MRIFLSQFDLNTVKRRHFGLAVMFEGYPNYTSNMLSVEETESIIFAELVADFINSTLKLPSSIKRSNYRIHSQHMQIG